MNNGKEIRVPPRIVAENLLYDASLERLEALLKQNRNDVKRRKRWLLGVLITLIDHPTEPVDIVDAWDPRFIGLWKRDDTEILEVRRNEARIIPSLERSCRRLELLCRRKRAVAAPQREARKRQLRVLEPDGEPS